MNALPAGMRVRILGSAKTGHLVPCVGLAQALGVEPEIVSVAPRAVYAALAPWGPADPRDASLREPFPDIAIASGRETVPFLRALRTLSNGRVFTVFLGDPRASRSVFDLIWAPMHDSIDGANVFKTVTAPHPHDRHALEIARAAPNPRLAVLRSPRSAVFVGGPSGQYAFGEGDCAALCEAVAALSASGSVMVSASRRTPQALRERLAQIVRGGAATSGYVWDGAGDNPYRAMLALADAFLVTADSVNMIGEAASTGRPVHVLPLTGQAGKFSVFFERLRALGAIRDWSGSLQEWSYAPVDATAEIAAETLKRYADFRARL